MNAISRGTTFFIALLSISSIATGQSRIIGLREKPSESKPREVSPPLPNFVVEVTHEMRGRITGFRPIRLEPETSAPCIPDHAETGGAARTKPLQSSKSSASFNGSVHEPNSNSLPKRFQSKIIGLRKRSEVATQVASLRPPSTTPKKDPKSDSVIAASKGWIVSGSRNRYLSLLEAIHKSLVCKRVIHSLGTDVSVESITLMDPDITAMQVPIAQSRFDPIMSSQLATNHVDRPPSSFISGGIPIVNKRDEIEFNSRLSKEWATGAITSVGYEPSLAYLFFPAGNASGFNPIHSSDLVLQSTQPLLKGAGRPTNLATIHIAENRLEQSRYEVAAKLQQQLRGIEQSYWQLHANHVRRKAIADAIALSSEIVEVERNRFEAGRVIYTDVARASFKLEDLFQQKLNAEREIQRSSLQISQLTGMDIDPSEILEPSDAPECRKPEFDLNAVIAVALQRNPNLLRQRHEIEVRQNQVQVARNQLQPQLDFRSSVRSGGLDNDLGSSIRDMSKFEFVDLTVGLVYARQVGNRAAKSKYRQSELEAVRVRELLDASERQVGFSIAESLNSVQLSFASFESALRQLADSQQWVKLAKIRYESPPQESGSEALLVTLSDYQFAIQSQVDALFNAALALADYNTKLASVEEQRGTLLERWSIAISNKDSSGPSPVATTQESVSP